MSSDCRTMPYTQTFTMLLAAIEVLAPNPRRKAFVLSPMAGYNGTAGTAPVIAQVFAAGAGQQWSVPNGVTQIIDAYVWGAAGSPGAAGVALGGGGGGGGGFATSGPLTVVPGTVYALSVDAAGGGASTSITDPTGTVKAAANSGASGALAVGGAGGAGTTGVIQKTGGTGATTANTKGGGGGGGAGNAANGGNGAGQTAGTGGGAATILGYGQGGAGGLGGFPNANGSNAASPGAGGGGGGSSTGLPGVSSDGVAVIFYALSNDARALSLSPRSDVVAGQGVLNFRPGMVQPFCLTDEDIGNGITEPWYAISGVSGVIFQITEYSYVPGTSEPAY